MENEIKLLKYLLFFMKSLLAFAITSVFVILFCWSFFIRFHTRYCLGVFLFVFLKMLSNSEECSKREAKK